MKFTDLEIGSTFHTGKSKENSFHKGLNGFRYCEFKKISKSESVCINQYGYGNRRMIGTIRRHATSAKVFTT